MPDFVNPNLGGSPPPIITGSNPLGFETLPPWLFQQIYGQFPPSEPINNSIPPPGLPFTPGQFPNTSAGTNYPGTSSPTFQPFSPGDPNDLFDLPTNQGGTVSANDLGNPPANVSIDPATGMPDYTGNVPATPWDQPPPIMGDVRPTSNSQVPGVALSFSDRLNMIRQNLGLTPGFSNSAFPHDSGGWGQPMGFFGVPNPPIPGTFGVNEPGVNRPGTGWAGTGITINDVIRSGIDPSRIGSAGTVQSQITSAMRPNTGGSGPMRWRLPVTEANVMKDLFHNPATDKYPAPDLQNAFLSPEYRRFMEAGGFGTPTPTGSASSGGLSAQDWAQTFRERGYIFGPRDPNLSLEGPRGFAKEGFFQKQQQGQPPSGPMGHKVAQKNPV